MLDDHQNKWTNLIQNITDTSPLNKGRLNNDLCFVLRNLDSPLSFECASHNAVDRIRPLLYKSPWFDN